MKLKTKWHWRSLLVFVCVVGAISFLSAKALIFAGAPLWAQLMLNIAVGFAIGVVWSSVYPMWFFYWEQSE